jgi:hypothetical protein
MRENGPFPPTRMAGKQKTLEFEALRSVGDGPISLKHTSVTHQIATLPELSPLKGQVSN